MKNLEQIRAAAALDVASKTSKAAVSKLPAMILANGLLAAAAFTSEKKKHGTTPKRPEIRAVFEGATRYLGQASVGLSILSGCSSADDLIKRLSANDSTHLQRATSETIAFIGYVKRYTIKEGTEEKDDA